MIAINLLPKEMRRKSPGPAALGVGKLPLRQIAVFSGLGLLAVHGLVLLLFLWTQADAASLSGKWKRLAGSKQQVDALKAEVGRLQERVLAFETITTNRFLWSSKLRQLSDAVIEGVWLSSLTLERKTGAAQAPQPAQRVVPAAAAEQVHLVLKGSAALPDAEGAVIVGRFMESLKVHTAFFQDFKEIISGGLQSRRDREVEIMDFTVSAALKRQAL